MRTGRKLTAEQERAWALLAAVEDHPRVQEWLASSTAPRARSHVRWAAAAALVVTIGVAFTIAYLQLQPPHYETAVGEQRDVLLPDGSRITLNTDTAVTVHYAESVRRIDLEQGEAIFSVKHDAQRPFDVGAGGTLTRALGTEFNVDMRNDGISVSVIEGVVRVSAVNDDAGESPGIAALTKGRTAKMRRGDARIVEAAADLNRIHAWRARRLEFSNTPLPEALAEFNRYSTAHVVIGTAELQSVRVSGVFSIGDTDAFLFSLRETLGAQTLGSADEIVLVRAAKLE
ncbi:MAG TPA: FecR domain-containing protein [Steroidobacteraceae bacterium]|jgi:transmembrane sensor|nr:FecR domain-containing protein [Steroidobacteraceae bacterium]